MAVKDRPKLKVPLTAEWVLVFCKSGRRFYHNVETQRSVWFAPDGVDPSVIDKDTMLKLIAHARGLGAKAQKQLARKEEADGEKEEEVEEEAPEPAGGERRIIIQDEGSDSESEPELEQQEPESSSDGEHIPPEDLESDDEDELAPEQKEAQFHEMLDSAANINPYAPWNSVMDTVVNDDRYDVYDSGKQRQESYDRWAKKKIADKKQASNITTTTKTTPEAEFLQYVKSNFSPKLFYLEFKRKHRKNAVFKNSLSDKERESLYRQLVNWTKKPLDQQKQAYKELMNSAKTAPESDPRFYLN